MKPKLLNFKDSGIPPGAVFIGRGSKWGNPFKIGFNGTRDEVIEHFKDYYKRAGLKRYIHELRGKDLVCYCAPLPCHGEFLLKKANKVKHG